MDYCFSITHESQVDNAHVLIASIFFHKKDSKLYVFAPKTLSPPKLDDRVELIVFDFDPVYPFFPFLDKIYAAAYCEQVMYKPFLWIDIDSYFNKELPDLFEVPIMVNPVDKKNIGILSNAPIPELWVTILQKANLTVSTYIQNVLTTTISKEEIFPYFNIGMVYLDPVKHIFSKTKKLLELLLSDTVFVDALKTTPTHQIFLHQAAFSVVVVKNIKFQEIRPLPKGLNFPLHLLEELDQKTDLNTLVSFRYDRFFDRHDWPKKLTKNVPLNQKELSLPWYYRFL